MSLKVLNAWGDMMINKIWLFLFMLGIGFAFFNGKIEAVHQALFSAPKTTMQLMFNMMGLYILWNGILEIVKDTKLIDVLARRIYFITRYLYPELPKDHPVHGYIATNLASNILGLGSVSTPLGIKAIQEMKKINGNRDVASRSMITLILINSACFTLVPTTLISLREVAGSKNSVGILPYVILASMLTTLVAILVDRLFYRLNKQKFESEERT